jgi:hypothetical protein
VSSSALGIDLLLFLSWRTFKAAETTAPIPREGIAISWEQLHAQMGGQYVGEVGLKEFARDCKTQLARIKAIWPKLRFETPRGRLVVYPSEPLVRPC